MPDMRKFLDPEPLFQRMLYGMLCFFASGAVVMFLAFMIPNGVPLGMLFIPTGPFALVAFFFGRQLVKSFRSYDEWWNSFSDNERYEIETDFNQAEQVSPYLIAGQRYAYIRNICRVIPYEEVGTFDFNPNKYGCTLSLELLGGGTVARIFPSYRDAKLVGDELWARSGNAAAEEPAEW